MHIQVMSRFTYKTPGIYLEAIPASPKPIQGVSTSVAAFIGETQKGPVTPTAVTSWGQFLSVFGGFFADNKYLPHAVWGYFCNGGSKCYVCRVTDGDFSGAIPKLDPISDISILYSPNAQAVPGLADAMISHCERTRHQFVIFDSLKSQTPTNITKPRESAYAAMYYPWIYIHPDGSKTPVLIPPGGHIAGIYARNDTQRGVHKAPANQVVVGATDLELKISDSQQDRLNAQGISSIRYFAGRGILLWGARTLSADPEYRYVNVRRLLIYLEQSIKAGTAWAAFEPNNEATWNKVRGQVENFLMQSWQAGMLMGAKQQEAYFVKCDRTTMTQTDIDNNRLVTMIGIAVLKPAEFHIFRVCQQLVAH